MSIHRFRSFLVVRRCFSYNPAGKAVISALDDGTIEEITPFVKNTTYKLFSQKPVITYTIFNSNELDEVNVEGLGEVAFIGKSNVGKSTLINTITKSTVAKTSKLPGKTQSINFYSLYNNKGYIVDLPGYGYARQSHKQRNKYQNLIGSYLKRSREMFNKVFLLIEAKRGIDGEDESMLELLDRAGIMNQIVITKLDLIPISKYKELIENVTESAKKHVSTAPLFNLISCHKDFGINELKYSVVTALLSKLNI